MKTQLQYVCGFAARRSPLNIINAVRITEGFCYATDGISSMRVAIDGPKLDVCVDAATLNDILRGFPDDQAIRIEEGKEHVMIHGGRRKLKLRSMPSIDMPEIEAGGSFHEVDAAAVATAMKFAAPGAAARNVAQPALTNVLIHMTDTGTFVVGTDSMRLHAYKVDDKASEHNVECLVPKTLATRLAGMCAIGGNLKINRHRLIYEKGDSLFISTISGLPYPPWRRIVPDRNGYDCKAMIDPRPLLQSVEVASRLGVEFIDLTLGGDLVSLFAENKGDQINDSVEAGVVGQGSATVRCAYIADALQALGLDKPVTVHVPPKDASNRKPILFTNDSEHICFAMGFRS